MHSWLIMIGIAVFMWLFFRRRGPAAQRGIFTFGRSGAREVTNETITFKDVAGVEEDIARDHRLASAVGPVACRIVVGQFAGGCIERGRHGPADCCYHGHHSELVACLLGPGDTGLLPRRDRRDADRQTGPASRPGLSCQAGYRGTTAATPAG